MKVLRDVGLINARVFGTRRLVGLRYGDLERRFPCLLLLLRAPA